MARVLHTADSEPSGPLVRYHLPSADELTALADGIADGVARHTTGTAKPGANTSEPTIATILDHSPLDGLAGRAYALGLRALELRLVPSLGQDDTLLAPDILAARLQAHPYQLCVVREVLQSKAPAAILADEVGLGKTIEAGLVLKELMLRDSVHTALVVTPKSLVLQWQDELRERFDEDFVLPDEPRFAGFTETPLLICSFAQLVRGFDQLATQAWDCLIVDEAHLLANPDSKRRTCVAQLRTRWRLLLTATPLQNRLTDLYSLVDLVSPGRLGTQRQFIQQYAADPTTCRRVIPARLPDLRGLTHEFMCRTLRAETGIAFAARTVDTALVPPLAAESTMMRTVTTYLRALYRRELGRGPVLSHDQPHVVEEGHADANNAGQRAGQRATRLSATARRRKGKAPRGFPSEISLELPQEILEERDDTPTAKEALGKHPKTSQGALIREIVALQQSLSSSPQAIAAALRRRAARHPDEAQTLLELAQVCAETKSAKEQLLREVLQRVGTEQAVIFTLRLETAEHLRHLLHASGRRAECFVGALSLDQRRDLIQRFNTGQVDTLIATDAGAEGLNLQERCHIVINFDLHWNPMKMEQRIGRVHRLGQQHAVSVINLALAGSIDEYVLTLLYQKIDLFTMTIGALETMLAELDEGESDIERRIIEIVLGDESGEHDEDDRRGSSVAETQDHAGQVRMRIEQLHQELLTSIAHLHSAESLTAEVLG